jgi:hypothetical protein
VGCFTGTCFPAVFLGCSGNPTADLPACTTYFFTSFLHYSLWKYTSNPSPLPHTPIFYPGWLFWTTFSLHTPQTAPGHIRKDFELGTLCQSLRLPFYLFCSICGLGAILLLKDHKVLALTGNLWHSALSPHFADILPREPCSCWGMDKDPGQAPGPLGAPALPRALTG